MSLKYEPPATGGAEPVQLRGARRGGPDDRHGFRAPGNPPPSALRTSEFRFTTSEAVRQIFALPKNRSIVALQSQDLRVLQRRGV